MLLLSKGNPICSLVTNALLIVPLLGPTIVRGDAVAVPNAYKGIIDPELLSLAPPLGGQQYTPSSSSIINVTKLDCGIREFAMDYAKRLANEDHDEDEETWLHVHEALRLEALCGIPFSKESSSSSASSSSVDPSSSSKDDDDNSSPNTMERMCAFPNRCIHVLAAAADDDDDDDDDSSVFFLLFL